MNTNIHIRNFINLAKGRAVRFGYDPKEKMYWAVEAGRMGQTGVLRRHANFNRIESLYTLGIQKRFKDLFESYCLAHIDFRVGDVIIDCGANSGDLYMSLSPRAGAYNYHCIEPNPADFSCLQYNCCEAHLHQVALSNCEGKLPFYVMTDTADSSMIDQGKDVRSILVDAVRLDKFAAELGLGHVKLLKVEAEGYEPEVLMGCEGMLSKCKYIAVDGGHERGPNLDQTLTFAANFLARKGFEMVDINFVWSRALFVNINLLLDEP